MNSEVTTASDGRYSFYAAPGRYRIQVKHLLIGDQNFPDVVLGYDPPTVVLVANTFPGADIGVKINAAVAALPSTGGTILISPGTYTFSTPIVLSGKNVTLSFAGDGFANTGEANPSRYGTRLVWTGGGSRSTFGVPAPKAVAAASRRA